MINWNFSNISLIFQRWILDRGELLSKEQLNNDCLTSIVSSEDQNPQVVFSPNIKGANSGEFAKK